MRNILFIGIPASIHDRPPRARVGTRRRIVEGVFLALLLGIACASFAPALEQEQQQEPEQEQLDRQQRQERPDQPQQQRPERPEQQEGRERQEGVTDWATDNLDMVSATPLQIREVLTKVPGLMVELKRLMAKQAIEKGQIVAEQDLQDEPSWTA